MAPSFNKSLKKKQPYFSIIEKNQEHPKRPYFDIVCYEIIKDDRFYKKLRYKNKPFFWGIVKFERFEGKKYMEPFKLWKLKKDKRTEEIEERYVDPDLFRNLIIMSKFIVIGDLKNKPSGYGLDNYQIVEEDTHKVQEIQQHEYKKSLQPVVDYCKNIQFDMRNVREYLFCHSCKQKNKYTLLDKESRYRSQAFYVCKKCAGREILSILKDKKVKISKTLKIILRDLLKKYKNVHKVLNVFNPNFNVIEHPEATLVNVKKKKIKHAEIKPQTIYDFEMSALLRMYFESHNHGKLLPVQIMSLEKGLMEGQDELIVAATSAGKTMIGEMAGLSKILENKIRYLKEKRNISNPFKKLNTQKKLPKSLKKLTKGQRKYIKELLRTKSKAKMLYLVPIVALANMRYREYQELEQYGINVALRVGVSHISGKGKRHKDEFGDFRNADVIVGTYEALDVLLRSGHPYHLHGVKTVVIDEIQMLADEERGFKLDGLIARLRLYLSRVQMLYLSATIAEPKKLSKSLRSALIHYNDRPVSIERHLLICMSRQAKKHYLRDLIRHEFKKRSSYGYKGQTIVFTHSRRNTESIAEYLNKAHVPSAAYHGGLNHYQRKKIEKRFEQQKIAAVVTTAALAAGVDFPASQVIFHKLAMGIKALSVADFEQMSGRAGRFKKHDKGKVYLLVRPGKESLGAAGETEEKLAVRLLKGKMAPLEQPLEEDPLYSEVLATISMYSNPQKPKTGIKQSKLNLYHGNLFNCGFSMEYALRDLLLHHYIKKKKDKKGNLIYRTTRFGKAVAQSFFTLGEADYIRDLLTDKVTEDNPPADPVIIAMHLEEFNNVYVTKRMIADLKTESQGNLGSNNLFSTSVLSMTGAEHMGKKGRRIPRGVFDTIIKWQEDIFNCNCEEKPYCECGKLNVAGYILDYRLSGLNFNQIAQTLKDVYEIKVFLGDLMDYIESIIYDLLAIEKIGKALDIPRETQEKIKEIPYIVDLLVKGPKGNHVDQGVLIDQRKHQKKKYGKKSKKK